MAKFTDHKGQEHTVVCDLSAQARAEGLHNKAFHKIVALAQDESTAAITHLIMATTDNGIELSDVYKILQHPDNIKGWLGAFGEAMEVWGKSLPKAPQTNSLEDGAPQDSVQEKLKTSIKAK